MHRSEDNVIVIMFTDTYDILVAEINKRTLLFSVFFPKIANVYQELGE